MCPLEPICYASEAQPFGMPGISIAGAPDMGMSEVLLTVSAVSELRIPVSVASWIVVVAARPARPLQLGVTARVEGVEWLSSHFS